MTRIRAFYIDTPTLNHPKGTKNNPYIQINNMTMCRIPTICGIDKVIAVLLKIMQFVYNCEHPIHMTRCHPLLYKT
jgi:hypothetical protein